MINFNAKQVVAEAMAHGLASIKPKPNGVFGPKQRYHHRLELAKFRGDPKAYHRAYIHLIRGKPL